MKYPQTTGIYGLYYALSSSLGKPSYILLFSICDILIDRKIKADSYKISLFTLSFTS